MTYFEKLKDPRWQKKRLGILNRDDFTCQICKAKDATLHVHHEYYIPERDPWAYPDFSLTTLCEQCHELERMETPHYGPNKLRAWEIHLQNTSKRLRVKP